MQEDRIKVADKCEFFILIFAGWNQISELCSSFFLFPPTPTLQSICFLQSWI